MTATTVSPVADLISDDDIAAFHRDGALIVRGLFSPAEIETIERGIERNLADPGPMF